MDAGLTPAVAERLVCLGDADAAFEIVHIAHGGGVPLPIGAAAYWQTGALVDLAWLRRVLPSSLPAEDRWEPRAVASLLEVLRDMRRQITLQVLSHCRGGTPIEDCLQAYAATRLEQLDVVNELINDLKAVAQPTLPALLVVIREVGRLARPPQPDPAW
jgi:NAD-specific glutamate dehydrogenase